MTQSRSIIVGGGPAGSACAIHLANAGARPLIVERESQPRDALCGGFLSWRTLDQLEALGITRAALGGHEVTHLRIVRWQASRAIALPHAAMGVSRRRLDQLLLARARELGADVRYASARIVDGRVSLDDGEVLTAESLFVATGKHELHGLQRPREAAGADPMTGLRWRIAPQTGLHALLAHHIEMHLFDRGYAGLVLHEDGSANLCMAVRKSRLTEAGGDPAELIAQLGDANPMLAERLTYLAIPNRFDAIGHIPYHWRATAGTAGIFRLGDQAGVIASLAGEGIGIAIASAADAVRSWSQGGAAAAPAFQAQFAARLRRPLAAARTVAEMGQGPAGARMLAGLSAIPGAMALVARATRI
jgi:flavin-dependent dehydrogenase